MTMYLPNRDIRPTGYEAGEFLEPPSFGAATDPDGSTSNDPHGGRPDTELQFLRALDEETASIAGDVLQVGSNVWAIHGSIPVDGEVLLAEFDSLDQATRLLASFSRTMGHDESR